MFSVSDFMTQGIEIKLEFEEDIEAELVDFVRLARQGLVEEAREQFKETLLPHIKLFPILAEYAEFLISEDCFTELLDILPKEADEGEYSPDERWLIRLLSALARCRTSTKHDTVESAASCARQWRIHVAHHWSEDPSDIEVIVQCLEIYLNIMVFASKSSVQLTDEDCQPPGISDHSSWSGFRDVTVHLALRDRKYWEAQKITRLLMKVYSLDRVESYAVDILSKFKYGWGEDNDRNAVLAWLIISRELVVVMQQSSIRLRSDGSDEIIDIGSSLIKEAGLQQVEGRYLSEWEACLLENRRRQQENPPVPLPPYLPDRQKPDQRRPDRQKADDQMLADKKKFDDLDLRGPSTKPKGEVR